MIVDLGCALVNYHAIEISSSLPNCLIENDNIANQIHGFTIDYGKFILICDSE